MCVHEMLVELTFFVFSVVDCGAFGVFKIRKAFTVRCLGFLEEGVACALFREVLNLTH